MFLTFPEDPEIVGAFALNNYFFNNPLIVEYHPGYGLEGIFETSLPIFYLLEMMF